MSVGEDRAADTAAGKITFLAALPREIRGLVRGSNPDAVLLERGIHLYRLPWATVVAAGMGAARVSLAFEAALAVGVPSEVVSLGLAGACMAELTAGAVVEPALVVEARTGERFGTQAVAQGPVLATVEAVAGVQEKARLAAAYGAALVDMEAATVARLAGAHGLRFRAVKGISDPHDFEMASLGRFASPHGHFRTAAFALHTALRPHHWQGAAQLGRGSQRALEALHARLRALGPA